MSTYLETFETHCLSFNSVICGRPKKKYHNAHRQTLSESLNFVASAGLKGSVPCAVTWRRK